MKLTFAPPLGKNPFSAPRPLTVAWAGVTVAVVCLALGGCALDPSGQQGQQCAADSQCADANPCTDDRCGPNGICEHQAVPEGEIGQQVTGDCLTRKCVAGSAQQVPEDSDVPVDGNSCTDDVCAGGQPSNPRLDEGIACEDANHQAGKCSATAECVVVCTAASPPEACDDGNKCTADSCDLAAGECKHVALPDQPAPDAQQVVGDCKQIMCAGGEELPINDNADPLHDGNQCTEDTCNSGVPSNPSLPIGTPCDQSGGRLCDGAAVDPKCVECNLPSDCTALPPDDECQTRTCTAGVCGQDFMPPGTAVAAQSPGDCQRVVCDGTGHTQSVADDADLPNDGNDCTDDVCTNGTPVHPSFVPDHPCGGGGAMVCDGSGHCLWCNGAGQCGTDTFCHFWTCDGGTCNEHNVVEGTALPPAQQANGDCQQLQCNGAGGVMTAADESDVPPDDGNQCTSDICSNGSPQHPSMVLDSPCSQNGGQYCDGTGTCVRCNAATQCPEPNEICKIALCASHACDVGDAPDGSPAPVGQQIAGDCHVLICDSSGNTTNEVDDGDGFVDGNQCTQDLCSNGYPWNPPQPDGTPCAQNNGKACNGVGDCVQCASHGDCQAPQSCSETWTCECDCTHIGLTCGAGSGVCSGLSCDDGIQQANETDVDCGGDPAKCPTRCANGRVCNAPGDCANNFCPSDDHVCCNVACAGLCETCAGWKSADVNGVCSAMRLGGEDGDECAAQPISTCGANGTGCSGTAGRCNEWGLTDQCGTAGCNGSILQSDQFCDGLGQCLPTWTVDCSPGSCDPVGPVCI